MPRQSFLAFIAALSIFALAAIPARADLINFVKIADRQQYGSFDSVAINSSGTVAFNTSSGVYRGNGIDPVTTIATTASQDSSGFTLNTFAYPVINDSGVVAFQADINTGGFDRGAYFGIGNGLTTVASTVADSFSSINGLDINNAGTIVFEGNTDTGNQGVGGARLFAYSGGTRSLLIDSANTTFGSFLNPEINEAGQIAFSARRDRLTGGTSSSGGSGIYRLESATPGATQTLIANSSNFSLQSDVSLNDSGQVVYQDLQGSTTSMYLSDGTSTSLIADTAGAYSFFPYSASINNQGTTIFEASLDSGGGGLYSGSNSTLNRLIGSGDALEGSTITNMFFSNHGLNNANQIAFVANLANGRSVIYRADFVAATVATPEPSTWVMFLIGLGSVVWIHKRKRKRKRNANVLVACKAENSSSNVALHT